VGLDGTIRFLKNRTGTWVLEECAREWADAGDPTTWDTLHAEALAAGSMGFVIDCNTPPFAERGGMVAKVAAACRAAGAPEPAGRGALVRLVLESLADSYRCTLDELESLTGQDVRVLHVVGGGSRNALLNQLTADVCGRRVVAGPDEATALGNLLVQARALGDLPPGVSVRAAARRSATLTEYAPRQAASPGTLVSSALRLPTDMPR
jgi:rhamnulokinase